MISLRINLYTLTLEMCEIYYVKDICVFIFLIFDTYVFNVLDDLIRHQCLCSPPIDKIAFVSSYVRIPPEDIRDIKAFWCVISWLQAICAFQVIWLFLWSIVPYLASRNLETLSLSMRKVIDVIFNEQPCSPIIHWSVFLIPHFIIAMLFALIHLKKILAYWHTKKQNHLWTILLREIAEISIGGIWSCRSNYIHINYAVYLLFPPLT